MALPSNNGIFIHEGLNCSPVVVPTAQSIPLSPSDSTSVKTTLDNKSDLSNIADTYDPTDTYSKDDCVIYEGVLYQCINSSGTTGTWVPADWTAVKAVDVGSGGGGGSSSADQVSYDNTTSGLSATDVQDAIDEIVEEKADRTPLPPEYDATSTYAVGDLVTYNSGIYQCKTNISTAEAWNSDHWTLVTPDTDYLHSINPIGYGSFSLNRKGNTTVGRCSFAEGYNCTASGRDSHAEGESTTASGNYSHAEGDSTKASSICSHAEGSGSTASGQSSHAEGYYTTANHKSQHTFGEYNILDDSTATALNRGNYIEIVGNGTSISARSNARTLDWSGNEVLSGGLKINSTQDVAAQVSLTQAEYDALVSAGTVDLVNTIYFITDADAVAGSAAEISYSNTTSGLSATNVQSAIDEVVSEKADRVPAPEAYDSTATYAVGDFVTYDGGIYRCKTTISTAEAWDSTHWTLVTPDADYLHSINPNGNGSFSLNRKSDTTIGNCSFAEGYNATASGNCSHSEGVITKATGDYSHAEGYSTTASGSYSHAEGSLTTASGISSHTEGQSTNASGNYSHTEGYNTTASGNNSHAEGYHTTSSAYATHSEGFSTQATTDYAHSEGASTEATGQSSHAEGSNTIANHRSQHVFGEYNVADPITSTKTKYMKGDYVEIVGNGTADNARSNARTLDWNGNEVLSGTLTATGENIVDSNNTNTITLTGSTGAITCSTATANVFIASSYISNQSAIIYNGNSNPNYLYAVHSATNARAINEISVNMAGIGGSNGYCRVCRITVTSGYIDGAAEFKIWHRGANRPWFVYLKFASNSGTDPDVGSFKYDFPTGTGLSIYGAYIVKMATSTWDLYIRKSQSWDDISIQVTMPRYIAGGVNMTYDPYFVTSLPSGYITATSF